MEKSPTDPESRAKKTSESRFRRKPDLDKAFAAIVKELGYDLAPQEEAQYFLRDTDLDLIQRYGVRDTAEAVFTTVQFERGPYEPANPSDVRRYISEVRTNPPLEIVDIGSVDEGLVDQLHLSRDRYIDELRDLITFLSPDTLQISVFQLPAIQQKMIAVEKLTIERAIVNKVLDAHGVSVVFDVEDGRAWSDLRELVEDLASENIRDYSHHLRQNRQRGTWTPIRDVIDTIDERLQIRQRAFELARSNVNAPPRERERLLQNLNPHMRALVNQYLEDLDAMRDAGNQHGNS